MAGPVLILLVLALVISLIVAAAWQKLQESASSSSGESNTIPVPSSSSVRLENGPASPSSIPSMKPSSSSESLIASDSGESSSSGESSQPEGDEDQISSQSGSSSSESPSSQTSSTAPAESDDYFKDALFIGDSLTEGISLYGLLDTTVIAYTGINPSTMMTSDVYEMPSGEEVTLMEAAKEVDAKKIYLMLGANGVAFIGKESFISYYSQIVEQLKLDHPDAVIYVQSILPVTKALEEARPTLANLKIDDYNKALEEMAKEQGVHYLNVAEAFKGSDGALPNEVSPNDGMHFGPSGYRVWFDYLLTHIATNVTFSPED